MNFSAEEKKYVIERIKYSYKKGFYEGMIHGVMVGIVGGIAVFNAWVHLLLKESIT